MGVQKAGYDGRDRRPRKSSPKHSLYQMEWTKWYTKGASVISLAKFLI